jgi:ATP-dependent protease ClpP protease subunit
MYSSKKRKYTCDDDESEENDNQDKNIYIINNHLYFSSDITPASAFTICKYLRSLELKLKMESITMSSGIKPEIYLHITTNGGCIYSAFSIIDCFKSLSFPENPRSFFEVIRNRLSHISRIHKLINKSQIIHHFSCF